MRLGAQVALAPTFRPEPRDPQQGLGLPEQQPGPAPIEAEH
jgi:hypothetical protein